MGTKEKNGLSVLDVILILLLLLGVTFGVYLIAENRETKDPGREIALLEIVFDEKEFPPLLAEGQTLYGGGDRREVGTVLSVWKNTSRLTGLLTVELRCDMEEGVCVPGSVLELETKDLLFTAEVTSAWPKESFENTTGEVAP